MADEVIRFRCGTCQKSIKAKSHHAGRKTRCPACHAEIEVPSTSDAVNIVSATVVPPPQPSTTSTSVLPPKKGLGEANAIVLAVSLVVLIPVLGCAGLMLIGSKLPQAPAKTVPKQANRVKPKPPQCECHDYDRKNRILRINKRGAGTVAKYATANPGAIWIRPAFAVLDYDDKLYVCQQAADLSACELNEHVGIVLIYDATNNRLAGEYIPGRITMK